MKLKQTSSIKQSCQRKQRVHGKDGQMDRDGWAWSNEILGRIICDLANDGAADPEALIGEL